MHEILADIIIRNWAVHEQHIYGATEHVHLCIPV